MRGGASAWMEQRLDGVNGGKTYIHTSRLLTSSVQLLSEHAAHCKSCLGTGCGYSLQQSTTQL